MPAPSRSCRQSHAPNLPIPDPHVDQVGLLPVPQDCDMPDIDWEHYDHDVDEPPQPPHSPVAAASANSKPFARHESPVARRLQQDDSPSAPRERTSSAQQHHVDDVTIPRRSSKTPDSPPSNNAKATSHTNSPNTPSQQTNETLQKSSNRRVYRCTLCDVSTPTPFNMNQHLKGKKHASKLKENPAQPSNATLNRPHNQLGQTSLAETRDARHDIEAARAENPRNGRASNSRLQPPSEHDKGLERKTSTRDTRKDAQRTANQRHAIGSAEASPSSATARPQATEERAWNARPSAHAQAGNNKQATSDPRKSAACPFRSSQPARHHYDTARSNMQHDAPSTSQAASRESSRPHRAEGKEPHPGDDEPRRSGGQSPTMASGLRPPSLAQRPSNEGGSSTTPDHGRYDARPTDSVETLKPIPWNPFSTVYDASKVGKQGGRIPQDFLDQKMSMSEWRELRRAVFEKGDDVDKLAFKILVEMLLSPTLGVREDALDGLNSAIKKMKNVHYFSKETGSYMRYDGVPEKLWKREQRFVDGDNEWLEAQSNEDKALHLICENLYYMFDQSENFEEMKGKAHFSTFPFRGGVTGVRSGAIGRIDGVGGRRSGDVDAVENDELFHQIHAFLLSQKVRPQGPQPTPQN